MVQVPHRLLARAARLVAAEQKASAQLLVLRMPVIPAMAERLMLALEGVAAVGRRDEMGEARVLVSLAELPELFERWGIVEDAP